jgi:hypothetical protein
MDGIACRITKYTYVDRLFIIPPLIERGAILQSPCLSIRSHFRNISQLLLQEMILYLIYGFDMVTCTVSPLSRFTAHLLPVYRVT